MLLLMTSLSKSESMNCCSMEALCSRYSLSNDRCVVLSAIGGIWSRRAYIKSGVFSEQHVAQPHEVTEATLDLILERRRAHPVHRVLLAKQSLVDDLWTGLHTSTQKS